MIVYTNNTNSKILSGQFYRRWHSQWNWCIKRQTWWWISKWNWFQIHWYIVSAVKLICGQKASWFSKHVLLDVHHSLEVCKKKKRNWLLFTTVVEHCFLCEKSNEKKITVQNLYRNLKHIDIISLIENMECVWKLCFQSQQNVFYRFQEGNIWPSAERPTQLTPKCIFSKKKRKKKRKTRCTAIASILHIGGACSLQTVSWLWQK